MIEKGNRQSKNRLVLFLPAGHRSGHSRIVTAARWSSSTKSSAALGAALSIPRTRFLHIGSRALVVLNAFSLHLRSPKARDAVAPRGRSQPCPLSGLPFGARPRCPRPPPPTHPLFQGCRAACSPTPRARQPGAPAHVSKDRKPLDSLPHPPCPKCATSVPRFEQL